jgi:ATP-dependent Clp protease protease subunit
MIHRSTNSPQFATSTKLQHVTKSLILDDERTEEIIRAHVNLPSDLWSQLEHHDLYLSGEEAVEFGLADGLAEFAPPAGVPVFNMLG